MSGLSSRASHARLIDQMPPTATSSRDRDRPTTAERRREPLGRSSSGGRPLRRYPLPRPVARRPPRPRPDPGPSVAGELDPRPRRARPGGRRRGSSSCAHCTPSPTRRRSSVAPMAARKRPAEQPERQEPRVPHRVLGPLHEEHAEHDRGDEQRRASSARRYDRGRDDARRRRAPRSTTAATAVASPTSPAACRRGADAAHDALRSCASTGSGTNSQSSQLGNDQSPAGTTFSYRMLCVMSCRAMSGSDQTAVSATRDGADRERERPRAAAAGG